MPQFLRSQIRLARPTFASLLIVIALFSLYACEEDESSSVTNYDIDEVMEFRAKKDAAFKEPESSPLPPELIPRFTGLPYFEVDEDFAVEATLQRLAVPDTLTINTTSSELRAAIHIGALKFEVRGKPLTLNAYVFIGDTQEELFVPFKDATSGVETYAGGRYINVPVAENDSAYVLDFNMAYHPYCLYNKGYSCPLVPKGNTLNVSIEAGEKN